MKAGSKIGKQYQLGFLFCVTFEASLTVCAKRFAQKSLSIGGLSRPQPSTKARQLIGIKLCIITKGVQKSRELTANLLEDFLIAAGDGITGASEGSRGIERLENRPL
ncbi:MAG: hypothetical protein HYV04_12195 [Deltaproteobacteria bacterium]|nr:hypothetical protein [Deltaproteobacteria bacterium]